MADQNSLTLDGGAGDDWATVGVKGTYPTAMVRQTITNVEDGWSVR